MVVQHNMSAMNANRMLGLTTSQQSKTTEKLSSGYKINRAADDAAGLSISEKMRKQIRGLDRASTNADDGVSCVQTAEGALNEVQDMLQRMNELAVQAANGTNSEDDRSYIQSEIDQLCEEIDRVCETTKFNETYLLKGDGIGGKYEDLGTISGLGTPASQTDTGSDTINDRDAVTGVAINTVYGEDATATFTVANQTYNLKDYEDVDDLAAAISSNAKVNSVELTYVKDIEAKCTGDADDTISLIGTNKTTTVSGDVTFKVSGTTTKTGQEGKIEFNNAKGATAVTFAVAVKQNEDGEYVFDEDTTNDNISAALKNANYSYTEENGVFTVKTAATMTINAASKVDDLEFNLHVGADSSKTNKISINIANMSADGLGISGVKVTSEKTATDAIDVIAAAIQKVSEQRSALGAVQNRLEHTINNLDNVVENTTAAESRIRDTDMAETMVKYSNQQILAQAGQSMLAQANQANQGVLSLLG